MKKTSIIVILIFSMLSCNEDIQNKNLITKLENLKAENDSLWKIVTDIKTKYVFDSIAIRDIPNYENTYQLNSKVSGEIVFVGYNSNRKTNVILIDSLTYNPKKLYNPDTLNMDNGGFTYETNLNADRVSLKGLMEIQSDYGKEYEGVFSSLIVTKKN